MKRHLTLTATHFPPFMFLNENDSINCKGITCNLIKYLSRSLNFTFDFIKYREKISYRLPNGNWTGLIGLIQQGVCLYLNIIGY